MVTLIKPLGASGPLDALEDCLEVLRGIGSFLIYELLVNAEAVCSWPVSRCYTCADDDVAAPCAATRLDSAIGSCRCSCCSCCCCC